jgi:hypothetical protein
MASIATPPQRRNRQCSVVTLCVVIQQHIMGKIVAAPCQACAPLSVNHHHLCKVFLSRMQWLECFPKGMHL